MKKISIRWRIMLWNTAAFAVVVVVLNLLIYGMLRKTHYDQLDRALHTRVREIQADRAIEDAPDERLQYWMQRIGKHVEIFGVAKNSEGEIVAKSEQLNDTSFNYLQASSTAGSNCDTYSIPGLGDVRRLLTSIHVGNTPYSLILLAELEHVQEEMDIVAKCLLITVPITLALAAGIAYALAVQALLPVERLRKMAEEITAEKLDRRLPILNPADELGHLAKTLNSMISRLEKSFNEVRRFTADASHELRTPIAIIRSEAEMVDLAESLPEACNRARSIIEECDRLTLATNQLLTLSHEDAGVYQPQTKSAPVASIVQEAVAAFRPLSEAKSQRVNLVIEDDTTIIVDEVRLRQIIRNLIDNAIKYTAIDGEIVVTVKTVGRELQIEIRDNGIGISAEHLPHIFDRFYRVDKSESSSPRGAGLGLSIVQFALESLNGRVEVTSEPNHGSTFTIFVPIPMPPMSSDQC